MNNPTDRLANYATLENGTIVSRFGSGGVVLTSKGYETLTSYGYSGTFATQAAAEKEIARIESF